VLRPRRRWRRWVVAALVLLMLFATRPWWCRGACLAMARYEFSRFDAQRAELWLNWSIRLTGEDGETVLWLARAYRRQGRLEDTRAALERALRLGAPRERLERENWLALAQSGQIREAEPHLPGLLTRPGNDGPEICEAFALGYMRSQRHAQAARLLEAWMNDWPHQARPYLLRGRLYLVQQQTRKAEADFRKALDRDAGCAEAAVELADILRGENRPKEAQPLYERWVHDRRVGTRAKVGLAGCLKALGRADEARSWLESALAAAPHDWTTLLEMGRIELEAGRYAAAEEFLRRALPLTWDDEVRYLLAQALQGQGKTDEAKPFFEQVRRTRDAFRELQRLEDELVKAPGDPQLLTQMGAILLEYADPEEGVLRLLAALDRDPRHREARQLLVRHYEQRALQRPEFQKLADWHRGFLTQPGPSER